VLFAISAAELMKKRSEVWSANIHGEELSQRRAPTIRGSAEDGDCLQLPFSLLCTSSHNINKLLNKQMKAQTRTPDAAASAPEGNCDIAGPVARVGLRCQRARLLMDGGKKATEKSNRRRGNGQERGTRCRNATRRAGLFCFFCLHAATLWGPQSGVCAGPPCQSGGSTLLQARQSRTRGPANESKTAFTDGLLMAIMANLLASVEGWGP